MHDAVVRVISADPVAVPLLRRFAGGVCVLDSTTITLPKAFAEAWPGLGLPLEKKLAGMKVQVRLNLADGTLGGPFLRPACDNEQKGALYGAALPPGTLHLADLGFFSLDHLQTLDRQDVFWVTRMPLETRFVSGSSEVWTLARFLSQQKNDTIAHLSKPGGKGEDQRT